MTTRVDLDALELRALTDVDLVSTETGDAIVALVRAVRAAQEYERLITLALGPPVAGSRRGADKLPDKLNAAHLALSDALAPFGDRR